MERDVCRSRTGAADPAPGCSGSEYFRPRCLEPKLESCRLRKKKSGAILAPAGILFRLYGAAAIARHLGTGRLLDFEFVPIPDSLERIDTGKFQLVPGHCFAGLLTETLVVLDENAGRFL